MNSNYVLGDLDLSNNQLGHRGAFEVAEALMRNDTPKRRCILNRLCPHIGTFSVAGGGADPSAVRSREGNSAWAVAASFHPRCLHQVSTGLGCDVMPRRW